MASVAVIPPRANSRRSLVVGGPLLSPKPTVSPKPGLKQQQPPAIRCDEVPPPTLEQMVALKRSLLKRQFSSSSSVHSQQRELPHKASLPVLLQPTPSSPDNNSLFDFLLDFSNHDAPPDEQSNSPSQNSKEQFRSTLDTPSSSAIDRALERITDAHLSGCESNQMFSKNEASLPMIQSNLHFKLNEEFINYNPSQPFSARSSPHAAPPVPLTDQADTAATPFPTFDLHDWALTSAMPLIPDMPPLFTMEEAEQLALDLFGDAGLTRGMDTSLDFRAATPSVIPPADVLPPTTTSSMEEGVVFEDHESDMDEGECEDDQVAQQTNEVEYTCADGLEQEPTFNEETQQGRAADVLSSCPTKAPTSFNTHVASTGTAPSNAKRARGRPRRDPATLASAQLTEGAPIEPVIKRPRGRPRKIVDPNVPIITTAKKRKASASVVPGTTVIVMAEPEAGVISAVDVGKEEGAASDAEDEDISWMMKMAEAAAMGKELPKRTTPLINNEADAAKLSLHKFRPQRPMAPDLAHQYLALKNPELDSKQRRQLRNKLSARSFRERRKEYIDSIEQELRRIVGENVSQKRELEAVREERDALKGEVEGLRGMMASLKIEDKKRDDMEVDHGGSGSLSPLIHENLKQEGHILEVRSALMPDVAHVFANMEDGALLGLRQLLMEHEEIGMLKGLQDVGSMPHASRAEVSGKEAVEWFMKAFDAIRNMFSESHCVELVGGGVDEVDFDDAETLFGEDGADLQVISDAAPDQAVDFDDDFDDESLNGDVDGMDDRMGPIERLMMALNLSQSPAWK